MWWDYELEILIANMHRFFLHLLPLFSTSTTQIHTHNVIACHANICEDFYSLLFLAFSLCHVCRMKILNLFHLIFAYWFPRYIEWEQKEREIYKVSQEKKRVRLMKLFFCRHSSILPLSLPINSREPFSLPYQHACAHLSAKIRLDWNSRRCDFPILTRTGSEICYCALKSSTSSTDIRWKRSQTNDSSIPKI